IISKLFLTPTEDDSVEVSLKINLKRRNLLFQKLIFAFKEVENCKERLQIMDIDDQFMNGQTGDISAYDDYEDKRRGRDENEDDLEIWTFGVELSENIEDELKNKTLKNKKQENENENEYSPEEFNTPKSQQQQNVQEGEEQLHKTGKIKHDNIEKDESITKHRKQSANKKMRPKKQEKKDTSPQE
ncbi:MAG: hypothetical protein EZS28_042858, partial [Streblomastix strix]